MSKEEQLQSLENQFIQIYTKWIEFALKGDMNSIGIKDISIEVYKDGLQKYRKICIEYGRQLEQEDEFASIKFIGNE